MRVKAATAPDPTRRSERARAAILEATARLVTRIGYSRLTIEAVAAEAGVGKQTIYRWWPSKAAIVLDVLAPRTQPLIEFPDTGDLLLDLKAQMRAVIGFVNDSTVGAMIRALVAESQHDEYLAAQLMERILAPRTAAFRNRMLAARARGELPAEVDIDIIADLLHGAFCRRYVLRAAPMTATYADDVVDHLVGPLYRAHSN